MAAQGPFALRWPLRGLPGLQICVRQMWVNVGKLTGRVWGPKSVRTPLKGKSFNKAHRAPNLQPPSGRGNFWLALPEMLAGALCATAQFWSGKGLQKFSQFAVRPELKSDSPLKTFREKTESKPTPSVVKNNGPRGLFSPPDILQACLCVRQCVMVPLLPHISIEALSPATTEAPTSPST